MENIPDPSLCFQVNKLSVKPLIYKCISWLLIAFCFCFIFLIAPVAVFVVAQAS